MTQITIPDKPTANNLSTTLDIIEKDIQKQLCIQDLLMVCDGYENLQPRNNFSQKHGRTLFAFASKYLEHLRINPKYKRSIQKNERYDILSCAYQINCKEPNNIYYNKAWYYSDFVKRVKYQVSNLQQDTSELDQLYAKADSLESCCNVAIIVFDNLTRANRRYNNGAAILDSTKY